MPSHSTPSTKVAVGSAVAQRELRIICGKCIALPDLAHLVHLQLRRFAGCPVLHLQSIVERHDEIVAAGINEVVVFHSTVAELLVHAAHLPFAVVADPDRQIYTEFGAEAGPLALLHPRAWIPTVRGIVRSLWAILRGREAMPPIMPDGGSFGLPADFLIDSDGRVLACKYGEHAYDQWSVDELLTLARHAHKREKGSP